MNPLQICTDRVSKLQMHTCALRLLVLTSNGRRTWCRCSCDLERKKSELTVIAFMKREDEARTFVGNEYEREQNALQIECEVLDCVDCSCPANSPNQDCNRGSNTARQTALLQPTAMQPKDGRGAAIVLT